MAVLDGIRLIGQLRRSPAFVVGLLYVWAPALAGLAAGLRLPSPGRRLCRREFPEREVEAGRGQLRCRCTVSRRTRRRLLSSLSFGRWRGLVVRPLALAGLLAPSCVAAAWVRARLIAWCVAVVQEQGVSFGVFERGHVADACVDGVAQELDALRFELGAGGCHVVHAQCDRVVVAPRLDVESLGLEDCDRQVAGLELGAGHLPVARGEGQAEGVLVEVDGGVEVLRGDSHEVGSLYQGLVRTHGSGEDAATAQAVTALARSLHWSSADRTLRRPGSQQSLPCTRHPLAECEPRACKPSPGCVLVSRCVGIQLRLCV